MITALQQLQKGIEKAEVCFPVGRVAGVQGGLIHITGLTRSAHIGDRLTLVCRAGKDLVAEVLQIGTSDICALPERSPDGVAIGDRAVLRQMPEFAPDDHWIGRVVDPYGAPLDGKPLLPGAAPVDIMAPPPPAAQRQPLGDRMETGLAVLNTMLPFASGQRLGLFAGSGVGKSRLLAHLARHMQADVVVLALVGERGREVNDFVTRVLGPEGMKRAIVVAATSDQSALTRRRCAWSAMAVAEHFRDQGKSVLFLADSITRFAEAHREIAVAGGEAPALRGFPPSVTPLITGLCERSGPGIVGSGSITAVLSVLVAGSDMDEPLADILRGVLDGHIVLSRDIAERGRFPAIDVGKSVSRSLPDVATEAENAIITDARRLLGAYEQSEVMIKAGLYSEGSDALLDQAVKVWPELDAYFARVEPEGAKASFDRLNLIVRRAGIGRDRAGR